MSPEKTDPNPVAWMHTLHMEGGQTYVRLSELDGTDPDEPKRTAFGIPGRDYSEEYPVTSQPLYTHPSPAPQADVVTEGELDICPNCDGSGEGVADTVCNLCNGLGGVPVTVDAVGYLYRDGREELFIRGQLRDAMVEEGWEHEPLYTRPLPENTTPSTKGDET